MSGAVPLSWIGSAQHVNLIPFPFLCSDCPIKLHQADRYQLSLPAPEGPCILVFTTIINTYRHLVVCKSLQWRGVYCDVLQIRVNTPTYILCICQNMHKWQSMRWTALFTVRVDSAWCAVYHCRSCTVHCTYAHTSHPCLSKVPKTKR